MHQLGDGYADLALKAKERTPRKEWLKFRSGTNQLMTETEKRNQTKPFDPAYVEHLTHLSKRNKLIRELQTKDDEQIELERRELGFTIYVNGAHAEKIVKATPRFDKPKTAETFSVVDTEDYRHSSAPERGRRKQWSRAEVKVKTFDGTISSRAADDYSADFDMSDDSLDDDLEEVRGCMRQLEIDPGKSRVLLSIDDVKELRRSLVKSIDPFRFSRDLSTISSVDDVTDDVDMSLDVEQVGKNASPWQPGDMIVLEFAPKMKVNDLSAKKVNDSWDEDPGEFLIPINEWKPATSRTIDQSEIKNSVKSDTSQNIDQSEPAKSVIRPVENNSQSDAVKSTDQSESRDISQTEPHVVEVEKVVKQVLQMEPDQQKKFLCMIENLAQSPTEENSKENDLETLTLKLELLSNWGHDSSIGLTEIQFFDEWNSKIVVNSIELNEHETVANLVNGKFKTTKDRNMWSTAFKGEPINILINLPRISLHKIKIWNFNKNLQDLAIGVKNFRIWKGDDLVCEGLVEKGCGNQIFDYSSTFNLDDNSTELLKNSKSIKRSSESVFTSLDVTRSEERVTRSSDVTRSMKDGIIRSSLSAPLMKNRTELSQRLSEKSFDDPRKSKDVIGTKSKSEECLENSRISEEKFQKNASDESAKELKEASSESNEIEGVTPRSKNKRRIVANFTNNDVAEESESMLHQLRTVKSKKSAFSDEDSLLKDWPNRGVDELPCEFIDTKPRRVHSGRRAQAATPRSDASDEFTPFPARDSLSARAHFRENCDQSLEESWSSLSLFNKNQRGRLRTALEDDVLDEYLLKKTPASQPNILEEFEMETEITEEESDFCIPELPRGRELLIDIRTTWGDKHYVGLTGIEIFSNEGPRPNIASITADPADINVLPEYDQDPRIVSNLIDGVNKTRDDTHMWLAPYTRNQPHMVKISFDKDYTLALLRFWNYNKSRIHSYRGARDITVKLDGRLIFDGEVAKSSGGDNVGETILFTTDDDILEKVSAHDDLFVMEEYSSDEEESEERPKTADEDEERPLTQAMKSVKVGQDNLNEEINDEVEVHRGQCIKLNFTQTWGDQHYLGLTGLSLVGTDGDIPLSIDLVEAMPADLTSLPGCRNDSRTLDKLLDNHNITMQDTHMWLIPFTDGEDHVLTITLPAPTDIIGIRVWNYNKNPEDTYRGAKILHVSIDDKVISPSNGYLIRKGPGNCFFDFAQEILFSSSIPKRSAQDLPCGFIYQFHLFNTHGDHYYVGLNGLEIYDENSERMVLNTNNIAAYPDSVTVLEGMEMDTRTPDKLINGLNETTDGSNMWLAPVIPNLVNRVFIIFDKPTSISMIKLWNYSKTPSRGVRDFGVYVDDLLVYNGSLEMSGEQLYHTIMFSADVELLKREKHSVIKGKVVDQDVQMTNDRNIVTHYSGRTGTVQDVDQSLRPVTAVPSPSKRQR